MTTPTIAANDRDIIRCFDLMAQLRPHLQREHFLATVRQMQLEAYQLAYIEKETAVACVAGFRISTNLLQGKNLYVDDLVTSVNCQVTGLGTKMMNWLRQQAIENGCACLHLDTGTQRKKSQRFYINRGMSVVAYHFSEQL